jgi:drug/metabolite transporter (DMT)-like permease
MNTTRRAGVLLALLTATISGWSVFVNSYAVKAFSDATAYTTAKNVAAGLLLAAVVAAGSRRGARLTRPASARQWWGLAAVGVVGGSIPFVLFFEGLAQATSAQAAFLHKTLLLWVAILAVSVLGERLQWGHWLAIGLLLVGQAGLGGGLSRSFGTAELLILAATLLWSVEVVVAKRLLRDLSSWTVALTRMALGSLVLIGWVVAKGDASLLVSLSAEQLGWLALTGLLLAAYVGTWFAALERAQAVDVTAVLVLAAPVTAVLDGVFRGTPLSPQLGWLAMLLAGGALAGWLAWRSRPQPLAAGV